MTGATPAAAEALPTAVLSVRPAMLGWRSVFARCVIDILAEMRSETGTPADLAIPPAGTAR